MMRKALSILGCLLLSIGSVAAEPSGWLSPDLYWFCESDASTSTNDDGELLVTNRVQNANDAIAYCTVKPKQVVSDFALGADNQLVEIETLRFTPENSKDPESFESLFEEIPEVGGYFINISAKFTPRKVPNVSASGDFPYRTLLYVTDDSEDEASRNHLAFLERESERVAARKVVTDVAITPDTFTNITIRVLKNNISKNTTFRVYVGNEEVTVGGKKRAFNSLQTGTSGQYYADYMHSFAFICDVALNELEFTSTKPEWLVESASSIPFEFQYESAAVSDVTIEPALGEGGRVSAGTQYTISFTTDTGKYEYAFDKIGLTGNTATLGDCTGSSITFTVGAEADLTDDMLVLKLPSSAYYMSFSGEKFGSFADAFEKAAGTGKPISLNNDVDFDSGISEKQAFIKDGQVIILDLNGKKIKGGEAYRNANDAAIYNRGTLKIIDSDPEKRGTIEAKGFAIATGIQDEDTLALDNDHANAFTVIKAGIFNGIVTNKLGRIQIDGGKFYNVFNQENGEVFYLRNQSGVSISAKFDEASIGEDNYWAGDAESAGKIEFRINEPSYAKLSDKLLSAEEVNGGARPMVEEAAGFELDSVTWRNDEDENIYIGSLTSSVYSVTFYTGGKAVNPPNITYSVDTESELPIPSNETWNFEGWYDGDKKVASLGKYATYEGSEGSLPEGLIFGNLELVARWTPIPKTWTNATEDMAMTEANGFFPADSDRFSLLIPASNGFSENTPICLKSIALSTVNASPNNLYRMAPCLQLKVGDETFTAFYNLDYESGTSDKFEYFKTGFGYRPKVVYQFLESCPTVSVNERYPLALVDAEGEDYPVLLRLVKRMGDSSLRIISTSSDEKLPSSEYKSYVPMYEIKGEAK